MGRGAAGSREPGGGRRRGAGPGREARFLPAPASQPPPAPAPRPGSVAPRSSGAGRGGSAADTPSGPAPAAPRPAAPRLPGPLPAAGPAPARTPGPPAPGGQGPRPAGSRSAVGGSAARRPARPSRGTRSCPRLRRWLLSSFSLLAALACLLCFIFPSSFLPSLSLCLSFSLNVSRRLRLCVARPSPQLRARRLSFFWSLLHPPSPALAWWLPLSPPPRALCLPGALCPVSSTSVHPPHRRPPGLSPPHTPVFFTGYTVQASDPRAWAPPGQLGRGTTPSDSMIFSLEGALTSGRGLDSRVSTQIRGKQRGTISGPRRAQGTQSGALVLVGGRRVMAPGGPQGGSCPSTHFIQNSRRI